MLCDLYSFAVVLAARLKHRSTLLQTDRANNRGVQHGCPGWFAMCAYAQQPTTLLVWLLSVLQQDEHLYMSGGPSGFTWIDGRINLNA